MKIYNWIDSFFDTKEKRRSSFAFVLLLYVLWQNIWQMLLFIRLYRLNSYDTLFGFLPDMNGYISSSFVRWIYNIVQNGDVRFMGVITALAHSISIWDILVLLSIALLYISSTKRIGYSLLFLLQVSVYAWVMACIGFGFAALSLQSVIYVLRTLSIGGIILELGCIYSIFHHLIKKIMIII